ncbi:hypothetical protein NUM3379_29250 [Kineococcus sp. NUM-3379]
MVVPAAGAVDGSPEPSPAGGRARPEPAMEALDELCVAVRRSIDDLEQVLTRAETVRTQRAQGMSYAQMVPAEARPLTVELISDTLARLAATGSRWRREEARALHAEGLSMDRIAQLFGVTRQRVSALLNSSPGTRTRRRSG